jgi:hypothetical protein
MHIDPVDPSPTAERPSAKGFLVVLDGEKLLRALNEHELAVSDATGGRDVRCQNPHCRLCGVQLEIDEISVIDGVARCAECHEVLIAWTDAGGA